MLMVYVDVYVGSSHYSTCLLHTLCIMRKLVTVKEWVSWRHCCSCTWMKRSRDCSSALYFTLHLLSWCC